MLIIGLGLVPPLRAEPGVSARASWNAGGGHGRGASWNASRGASWNASRGVSGSAGQRISGSVDGRFEIGRSGPVRVAFRTGFMRYEGRKTFRYPIDGLGVGCGRAVGGIRGRARGIPPTALLPIKPGPRRLSLMAVAEIHNRDVGRGKKRTIEVARLLAARTRGSRIFGHWSPNLYLYTPPYKLLSKTT